MQRFNMMVTLLLKKYLILYKENHLRYIYMYIYIMMKKKSYKYFIYEMHNIENKL